MLVRLHACALVGSCASAGDPPGGPPDPDPPQIVAIVPESLAIVAPPSAVEILLDEVIAERIIGQRGELNDAVLLSPALGPVSVSWHRNRLRVRPREGFRPGLIYRVEVLPVLQDLRNNRLRPGVSWVFSTGPEIPEARLQGAIVDWAGGRAAPNALIEAVLLPDSLPYRWLTDSSGVFHVAQMPRGEYLVYGVLDGDGNRRRGLREAYDTARVLLDTAVSVELYAFPRDTLPPRLRQIEPVDSLTLRLTFDRPLDPDAPLDTALVTIAPEDDSTSRVPLAGVFTPRELGALRAREDSARAAARRDSAPADTVRAEPVRVDTAAAAAARRPPLAQRPGLPPGVLRPGGPPPVPGRDSSRADRMLARRPPPSDVRLVRLEQPLEYERRYLVIVEAARSLNGVTGRPPPGRLRLPRPRPPAVDSTRRDTVSRRDTATVRDTTVRRPQ